MGTGDNEETAGSAESAEKELGVATRTEDDDDGAAADGTEPAPLPADPTVKTKKLEGFEQDLQNLEKEANENEYSDSLSTENLKAKVLACWNKAWDTCPRTCAIGLRVVLPMFILVFLSSIGGWALAGYEAPDEYDANDEVMRNRKIRQTIDFNRTAGALLDLPMDCLDKAILDSINASSVTFDDGATVDVIDSIESVVGFIQDVRQDVSECAENAEYIGQLIQEVSLQVELEFVSQDLTFDWIRCWNETRFGPIMTAYIPTEKQLLAAQTQALFYESSWEQSFDSWYDLYLDEAKANSTSGNLTLDELEVVFSKALSQATGRGGCQVNQAGTTWFFFTVMTTVGYGNQAPVSTGGRCLVATFGFFTIICFGAILANTGNIVAVIYDDLVKKFNLTPLSRPLWSCLFWAVLTACWTLGLGAFALRFWKNRLPSFDVPSPQDARWFAYISTTTVGLGDYFLEPEVMFAADALYFSFIYLVAFTFFAAFLTRLSDYILGYFFPDAGEVLKLRLEKSNFGVVQKQTEKHHEGQIQSADGETGPTTDDDNSFGSSEDLVDMLVKYVKSPARTLGIVGREEELLLELLKRVKEERLELKYMGARPAIRHQMASRNLGSLATSVANLETK